MIDVVRVPSCQSARTVSASLLAAGELHGEVHWTYACPFDVADSLIFLQVVRPHPRNPAPELSDDDRISLQRCA